MKKATLTFGLFSLVVLTSFTQVSGDTGGSGGTTTTTTTTSDSGGNQGGSGTTIGSGPIGGGNKKDIMSSPIPFRMEYKNPSGQVVNFRQKSDN